MSKQTIYRKLHNDRDYALVLFTLGQTPSYIDELSDELQIAIPKLQTIIASLSKYGLIIELGHNRIPLEIFPLVYEKCSEVSPNDPLSILDSYDFYILTQKGQRYLELAGKRVFNGCGRRGKKRRLKGKKARL